MGQKKISNLHIVTDIKVLRSTKPSAIIRFLHQIMGTIKPIVLSGPSGCGKSTIINMLMKEYPSKFGFSVSHTTRQPRPGEVDGKDYHFTQKEKMEVDIKGGLFI